VTITFIYELDPYSLEIYQIAKLNFPRQSFRKLASDRQTDTAEIIYHAASRMVNKVHQHFIKPTTFLRRSV